MISQLLVTLKSTRYLALCLLALASYSNNVFAAMDPIHLSTVVSSQIFVPATTAFFIPYTVTNNAPFPVLVSFNPTNSVQAPGSTCNAPIPANGSCLYLQQFNAPLTPGAVYDLTVTIQYGSNVVPFKLVSAVVTDQPSIAVN